MLPRIVLTPGDPTGIGPEIAAKACTQSLLERADITILGDAPAIRGAFHRWATIDYLPTLIDTSAGTSEFDVAPEATAIRMAVEGCLSRKFDALVTGPINKTRLMKKGFPYPGHTQYLAALTNSSQPVMSFVSQNLRVSLVTDHVPLQTVSHHLSVENILQTIVTAHETLRERYQIPEPQIAVCGLNPHAGESGRLGSEEISIIGPAIKKATERGICASGPHAADSIFSAALNGKYDLVVALYHDQGLIPIKLLGLGSSVHVTFGLPIVRTSVDHGTAYDIAGEGIANAAGMIGAIDEAIRQVSQP